MKENSLDNADAFYEEVSNFILNPWIGINKKYSM